jgi:hypothetical protein
MHEIWVFVQERPVFGLVALLLVVMLVWSALKSLFKLTLCLCALFAVYAFFMHQQGKDMLVFERTWTLPSHVR